MLGTQSGTAGGSALPPQSSDLLLHVTGRRKCVSIQVNLQDARTLAARALCAAACKRSAGTAARTPFVSRLDLSFTDLPFAI